MMSTIFEMMANVFKQCSDWALQLHEAMGTTGYLIAAAIIVLVVSLLIVPMRGGSLSGNMSNFTGDMIKQSMHTPKHWNGKSRIADPRYKGKFEKRAYKGHRAPPRG